MHSPYLVCCPVQCVLVPNITSKPQLHQGYNYTADGKPKKSTPTPICSTALNMQQFPSLSLYFPCFHPPCGVHCHFLKSPKLYLVGSYSERFAQLFIFQEFRESDEKMPALRKKMVTGGKEKTKPERVASCSATRWRAPLPLTLLVSDLKHGKKWPVPFLSKQGITKP